MFFGCMCVQVTWKGTLQLGHLHIVDDVRVLHARATVLDVDDLSLKDRNEVLKAEPGVVSGVSSLHSPSVLVDHIC